ncbi:unnamed protein product [Diatraea saccharalis]|uniref:PHD-type domain-containing protein n=1 Tax=Diatraea saccharalis TaxID=40085 RepID=A0A9P0FXY5_9NEOP|nr:unnamed protein product [Diatraea saccharalis]
MNTNKCTKCKRCLPKKEFLACIQCKSTYHLECVNVTVQRYYNTMTPERRRSWRCDTCLEKRRKANFVAQDNNKTIISPQATSSPRSCNRFSTPQSKDNIGIIENISTQTRNITHRRKHTNVVVTENSFESLSVDYEEEDTIPDSSPESTNALNRSCPDIRSLNITERVKELECKVANLTEKLASAEQEIVNLLSENGSLKEINTRQENKILQLKTICGSFKKTPSSRMHNSSKRRQSGSSVCNNYINLSTDISPQQNDPVKEIITTNDQLVINSQILNERKHKIKIVGDDSLADALLKKMLKLEKY